MAAGMKDKNKIHVNAAALVDLKAALFSKQREAAKERKKAHDGDVLSTRKVSEKTSSIWRRNVSGPGKRGKRGNAAMAAEEEKGRVLSQQEEEELEKSRRSLEAKAALYEQLSRGEGLKELSQEEEEREGGGDAPVYMVDFTKKVYEAHLEQSRPAPSATEEGGGDGAEAQANSVTEEGVELAKGQSSEEDGEWVEYVDSLGRSRRCLKEDLDEMKRRDQELAATTHSRSRSPTPDLLSDDMRMDRERRRWEEEERAELDRDPDKLVEPVHYQSVQAGEVRSHGVGYFAFSTDAEKRKEELDMLNTLRDQTFSQREKRQQLEEKRKALKAARLSKVRQRKLQKLKEAGEEVTDDTLNLVDFGSDSAEKKGETDTAALLAEELNSAKEKARAEQERKEEEKRAAHVRPWDKGKIMDPIRKRKKELQDERPNEFAPPTAYTKSRGGPMARGLKRLRVGDGTPGDTNKEQGQFGVYDAAATSDTMQSGEEAPEVDTSLSQGPGYSTTDASYSTVPPPPPGYFYPPPPPYGVPFPLPGMPPPPGMPLPPPFPPPGMPLPSPWMPPYYAPGPPPGAPPASTWQQAPPPPASTWQQAPPPSASTWQQAPPPSASTWQQAPPPPASTWQQAPPPPASTWQQAPPTAPQQAPPTVPVTTWPETSPIAIPPLTPLSKQSEQ